MADIEDFVLFVKKMLIPHYFLHPSPILDKDSRYDSYCQLSVSSSALGPKSNKCQTLPGDLNYKNIPESKYFYGSVRFHL